MHVILLLMLSVLTTNSNCFSSVAPEIEEPSTEQVRQIAKCMVVFHKEMLESVTASLKADKVLYDFFGHKKGKKYKISKGICTLGRLKSFSSRLQDDIDEITSCKNCITDTYDQLIKGALSEDEISEAFSFYEIEDNIANSYSQFLIGALSEDELRKDFESEAKEKVDEWLYSLTARATKLTNVKTHVDTLISMKIPQSITLKKSWKYFESHIGEYLPGMSVVKIAAFKPRFFSYVSEYYGLV